MFGLHALRFEPTRGMTREEGQRMAARLRRRWAEISRADEAPERAIDARAVITGRVRVRGPVDVSCLRHRPQTSLVSSADGALSTLVGAAAGQLVTKLLDRESFDLVDALALLEEPANLPRDRLILQAVQSLAELMEAGVVVDASASTTS